MLSYLKDALKPKSIILPDGSSYTGQAENGIPHGNGKKISSDGKETYEGHFVKGLYDGKGILTCPTYRYEGNFSTGKRDGIGLCTFQDGSYYRGAWKNDKRHGDGFYQYTGGKSYRGSFFENEYSGHGTLIVVGQFSYIGEFLYNSFFGQGEMNFKNGDQFKGHFKSGLKDGPGILYRADGSRFEGSFKNDKKTGIGTEYNKDGLITSYAFYLNNQLDSEIVPMEVNSDIRSLEVFLASTKERVFTPNEILDYAPGFSSYAPELYLQFSDLFLEISIVHPLQKYRSLVLVSS